MSSETISIKALGGASVLCQISECGEPARYLFSASKPTVSHTAYCETHGDQFAKRHGLLPPRPKREAPANRWSRATA
jgi:hypothetical protein